MTVSKNDPASVEVGPYGPSGRSLQSKIDRDFGREINHLIHLGYDLVGAYESAIARVVSRELAESFLVLQMAHRERIAALSETIGLVGGKPTRHGDLHGFRERGRVVIATLVGDRGIIEAMAENEDEMMQAYQHANKLTGLPQEVRAIIAKAVSEEGRHRAIYDRLLDRFVG